MKLLEPKAPRQLMTPTLLASLSRHDALSNTSACRVASASVGASNHGRCDGRESRAVHTHAAVLLGHAWRTLTHSTLLTQSALARGGPDRLTLTTPRPVLTASSHTALPTKPLPPNTRMVG